MVCEPAQAEVPLCNMLVPPVFDIISAAAREELGDSNPLRAEFLELRDNETILRLRPRRPFVSLGKIIRPTVPTLTRIATRHLVANRTPVPFSVLQNQ
jgi:hypothetical protein